MTNETFVLHLLESFDIYLLSFVLSFVLYYWLYKGVLGSIFDPLTLQVVGSMFGFSVVLFLFFKELITSYYFTNYVLTQSAFFLGFFIIKQRPLAESDYPRLKINKNLLITETSFLVFSLLNILLQIVSYVLVGIPLYKDSRLETYMEGGGIGLIGRLLSVLVILGLFTGVVTFFQTQKKQLKWYFIFYCMISAVFFFLSGSRSSFITFFIIFFFYKAMIGDTRKKDSKKNFYWLIVITIAAILIMYLKADSLLDASSDFLKRIVGFGDVYWAAYPEDNLSKIEPASPFYAVFGDILASYRIVGWSDIPKSIGLQLFNMNYPYWDVTFGSNARHNVFGLVYFGYIGSILFSFILGLFLGAFRMYGFKNMRNVGIVGMFYCVLYMRIASIETDIGFVVSELNSLLMTLILVFPFIMLLYIKIKKYE